LPCERVTLSFDNQHDESKVVFNGAVVFDTTANRVNGKVLDRSSSSPLANAIILLKQDNRTYADTTDSDGIFSVFEDDFTGTWSMSATHSQYNCLIIDSIMVGGGQDLTLKLKRLF
jgi:hypothetical protein